jgi:hypothetical protein
MNTGGCYLEEKYEKGKRRRVKYMQKEGGR